MAVYIGNFRIVQVSLVVSTGFQLCDYGEITFSELTHFNGLLYD